MEKIVIVGGGVSGLSCLNALLDRNVNALLLEGNKIGSPKICGEFIAPSSVSVLKKWQIEPVQSITKAKFFSVRTELQIPFASPAGAIARSKVEEQLAKRAITLGGNIREQTSIKKITPKENRRSTYLIELTSGEQLTADTIFFALGRFIHEPKQIKNNRLPYWGFKFHLPNVMQSESLLMYSLKNAYLGLVPISNEKSNCACLMRTPAVEKNNMQEFFLKTIKANPLLAQFTHDFSFDKLSFLSGPVPAFKIRKIPTWRDAYFIGDALVGFQPAVGSGFAHSIESALLAATYFLKKDYQGYNALISQNIKRKFLLGQLMHHFLIRPAFSSVLFSGLKHNPWLVQLGLRRLNFTP